jgi:TolB-like protein/Flp pilus assembly protein TadD
VTEVSRDQTTWGHDVFVSYASQDRAVANSVVENLELHGCQCWIAPRDVVPGSQYADEIVGAINETKVLVLVLSEHVAASAHVGREIERAASKRRRIIVLRIDAAPLTRSFEYFLSESQWIDVAALGMPAALAKLTQAVGQCLAPSSWVSPGLGVDVKDPADRKRKNSYVPMKRVVAAAVFFIVAAIVVGVMVRYWPKQGVPPVPVVAAISDKSIAVLAFTDMSEKKDQEYFADGMAEEIIDLLEKIPGLKVISRTSSFQFKGRTEDLRSIGTQLGVAYVLEGSVRKSGDRLRVTAQLINSREGTHLFSQTYDRNLSDVLKMQDEIAASLVRALQIEVSPEGAISRPTLGNAEAYTLYLQGLHSLDRTDQQGFEQALSDFQHAIELDPSFAAALDGLASAYFLLGQYRFMPPRDAFEKSRAAAEGSLKLNPNHAQPHVQLGNIHRVYDWDWTAAEQELQQARTLAPNDANALFASASLSLNLGRWDDALKLINASLAQDPLSPPGYMVLNLIQLSRNQPAQAEAAIRRTLDISPTFSLCHYLLGDVLLARGQTDAALAEYSKESIDGARLGGSAMAYYALGRKSDSEAALGQLLEIQNSRPFTIARVYAFQGESDEAFKWLDRAYAQRDPALQIIKNQLVFMKKLENDPRYKAFLKKMNLADD